MTWRGCMIANLIFRATPRKHRLYNLDPSALLVMDEPKGREGLGMLIGLSGKAAKKYVDDIMQTAQLTRHDNDPNAQRILTDEECKERAKLLIEAFAKTI
jgi:hypothetical protein